MGFKEIILNFPKQFKKGAEAADGFKSSKSNYGNIIFCGMGGSALPSELLIQAISHKLQATSHIYKNFDLPQWTSSEDLVICTSWSGNVLETLSSYQMAKSKNIEVIAITKGGALGELAQKDGTLLIKLPDENIPPRMATGYMFGTLLTFLSNSAILQLPDNSELLKQFQNLENNLKPETFESIGRGLAQKLNGHIPLIYASYEWRKLALVWKIKFNEDAKIHAFWNYLPGLAHNEATGFSNLQLPNSNFQPFVILLKDENDDPRIQKKFSVLEKILKENNTLFDIVNLTGNNTLEKIFNNYVLASWTSYHLAKLLNIDPASDKLLERFKQLEKKL